MISEQLTAFRQGQRVRLVWVGPEGRERFDGVVVNDPSQGGTIDDEGRPVPPRITVEGADGQRVSKLAPELSYVTNL